MVDKSDIVAAINAYPAQAAEALASLQLDATPPITMVSLAPLAGLHQLTLAEYVTAIVEAKSWTDGFVQALRARSVPIAEPPEPSPGPEAPHVSPRFDPKALGRFMSRAGAFQCRIVAGEGPQAQTGSGCLVGPSLVLTAWHVVAAAPPASPAPPPSGPVEVILSDGQKRRATMAWASACTDLEYQNSYPRTDLDYEGRHDAVLLQLERPDGARLGYASLPATAAPLKGPVDLMVLDFPEGRDSGWANGRTHKLTSKISARVGHDAPCAAGSSGAPCFGFDQALIGLHQGRWTAHRRLVPLTRFLSEIRDQIDSDVAPSTLWSLDGGLESGLIIGRDLYFEAIAEASRPESRARGIRVRRRDILSAATGLSFSYSILSRILEFSPGRHRLLRIGFEQGGRDLFDLIVETAARSEIVVPSPQGAAGVREGETTQESALNERARVLAVQLNAAVERAVESGVQLLWLFFENPQSGLAEAERYSLEAFVAAAATQPALRVVMAGFETLVTPGLEFSTAGMARVAPSPGMIVEFVGWFQRADVQSALERAAKALGLDLSPDDLAAVAGQALKGLQEFNGQFGFYGSQDVHEVSERLIQAIGDRLDQQGGAS